VSPTVAPRGVGGWLLLLPLLAVLGVMIAVAVRGERSAPIYRPHESGKATLDPEV